MISAGPHGRVRTLIELDEASAPMHEFRWHDSTRRIDVEPLLRVPKADADLAELTDVLQEQRESVLRGAHVLPERLRAHYADARVPPPAPSTDRDLFESFQRETCNGCHSRAFGAKDGFFHISPRRHDEQKLSQFFDGEDGELEVRARALGDALCE